jgi:hypothetical protein
MDDAEGSESWFGSDGLVSPKASVHVPVPASSAPAGEVQIVLQRRLERKRNRPVELDLDLDIPFQRHADSEPRARIPGAPRGRDGYWTPVPAAAGTPVHMPKQHDMDAYLDLDPTPTQADFLPTPTAKASSSNWRRGKPGTPYPHNAFAFPSPELPTPSVRFPHAPAPPLASPAGFPDSPTLTPDTGSISFPLTATGLRHDQEEELKCVMQHPPLQRSRRTREDWAFVRIAEDYPRPATNSIKALIMKHGCELSSSSIDEEHLATVHRDASNKNTNKEHAEVSNLLLSPTTNNQVLAWLRDLRTPMASHPSPRYHAVHAARSRAATVAETPAVTDSTRRNAALFGADSGVAGDSETPGEVRCDDAPDMDVDVAPYRRDWYHRRSAVYSESVYSRSTGGTPYVRDEETEVDGASQKGLL